MQLIEGREMAKDNGTPPRRKQGRLWKDRKGTYQSISVFRDLARMCAVVAKDEGLSVAQLTEPLLRGPLTAKYKRILERELRGMGDGES